MRTGVDSYNDITRDNIITFHFFGTVNVNLSILRSLRDQSRSLISPAEKLPFQSLSGRLDWLDFRSKRWLIVGRCIFGFICFIINFTSDLVRGVKLVCVVVGPEGGGGVLHGGLLCLIPPGERERVDGNVLTTRISHGVDCEGDVRVEFARVLS